MIKEFSVKGFKQFGKQITFNFSNVRNYNFSNECLSPDKNFIKTVLIYGLNASGKSNLGYALFDIVQHLVDRQTIPIAYSFYLNADNPELPAKFHYLFSFNGCEVEYNYSKIKSRQLVAEELLIEGKPVFYWDDKKEDFSNLKDLGFALSTNFIKTHLSLSYGIWPTILFWIAIHRLNASLILSVQCCGSLAQIKKTVLLDSIPSPQT